MSLPSLAPGTRLGPYEVVSAIGAGGMGEVYRARDPRLNRDVALKILPADAAADPSRRQRFEIEARAVAALSHPNIVAVYDVGEGFIVSELVEGEPLRGARFGLRKTLDIAAQIAGGLAAAHAAGVVHRDLKPDNILLTRDGRAKILDFGLARMTQPSGPPDATMPAALTGPGVVMGTVGYMSPEQVRGLDADHRSDIFSFGVVLHEMLGRARPFEGETAVDTMQAILREDAPDLPSTVPAGVRQVVSHCLEKDPAHRFQSARDLGFALRALAEGDSTSGSAPAVASPAPPAPRTRAWLVAGDGASAIAAVPANALTRIVRVPLHGPRVPEDLFTVTGDVWDLDVAATGAVDVNVADRPGEVVRFAPSGAEITTLARFPRAILSKMAVALPDGRDVVNAWVSGRMRLMVMAEGKSPEPLLKTQEESAAPMTAVAGNRMAFAVGAEPRETIAVADIACGRILSRITPQQGVIQTMAASADGERLYFTASGSVWSVATAGGEPRRIGPGLWVLVHPSGTLIVARNDGTQVRLFEVSTENGTERAIAVNPGTRFQSIGGVRADGLLAATVIAADSWFIQLALVDLKSGRTTRRAGDGTSEVVSAAWTRDGQILALKQGMDATIWTFTRNGQ